MVAVQNGDILMPVYQPPTPPTGDNDVYIDSYYGYLYKKDTIPESQLPPVYVPPKIPKKVTQTSILKGSTDLRDITVIEVGEGEEHTNKKSPAKVQRRDEPIFAPRSLFDRPSPALAKMRRDFRLQKYSGRPMGSTAKNTLGPGSISFPIIAPGSAKPPPPLPPDMPEWLIAEDHALVQVVQNMLELPASLLVVNLAQTPNWELASEAVNMVSKTYRTPKHCKWRYENIVGPREEGKLVYETALSPGSPASKKKKLTKPMSSSFIKINPPSPSKAARYLKTSQLMAQDNHSQLTNLHFQKFDAIKSISNKRTPTSKPITVNPSLKSNKQAAIFLEHGINYDAPLSACQIAQTRLERITQERKKLIQQQAASASASSGASSVASSPSTSVGAGSTTATGSSQQSTASASSSGTQGSSTAGVVTESKLTRSVYPSVSGSSLVPLVLGTSSASELLSRGQVVATAAGGQKRQIALTQQQQQYLIQTQQKLQQQVQLQQALVSSSSSASSAGVSAVGQQQILRPQTQQQQQQQQQPQTVVISSGLAQALNAAVSNAASAAASSPAGSAVSSSAGAAKGITIPQSQIQRMASVSMQDMSSSVGGQPSLVSLPITTQITTKFIQGSQGIATLVQAPPRATTASAINIANPQGLTASQQVQGKETGTVKRIVVSSGAGGSSVVTTPTASALALQTVTVVQSGSVFTQTSSVTASALTAAQKQLMKQQQQNKSQTRVSESELQAGKQQLGQTVRHTVALSSATASQLQSTQAKGQVTLPFIPQNLMKLHQIGQTGQLATLVRTPVSQGTSQSGTLTLPLQLSQVKTINKVGGQVKQQSASIQQLSQIQQQLLLQRRQQQQQPIQVATGSKITQLTQQVTPTQVILQTTPKQIQNTISTFPQVFKQVSGSGQVINTSGQIMNVIGKPMAGSSSGVNAQLITPTGSSAATVTIPASLVNPSQQNIQARVFSVTPNSGLKQTIQVVTPGILGTTGTLARPAVPLQSGSATYQAVKLPTGGTGQPVSIRLQSATVASTGSSSSTETVASVITVSRPGVVTTSSSPETTSTSTTTTAAAASSSSTSAQDSTPST